VKRIKRNTKIVLAVSLVLLASWTIGGIVYTLPNIEVIGEEHFRDEDREGRIEDDIDEGIFSLLLNTLFALILGILSGSIMSFMVVKRRDILSKIFTFTIIALGLAVVIYTDIDIGISGLENIGFDPGAVGIGTWSVRGVMIGFLSLLSIILLIIVIMSINAFFTTYTPKEDNGLNYMNQDEKDKIADEISKTVDKAVTDLTKGDDIRDVIIKVYLKMCDLFESKGVSNEMHMTPGELKERALKNFDIDEKAIGDITKTFEEARYSTHIMKESDRDRVLHEFKVLKSEFD